MFNGSPHDVPDVVHVLVFELISDRFPRLKSMAKELTLFPVPLLPCVSTYKSPEGREEELPQLSKNKLRAHTPTSAIATPMFFDICSPKGSPHRALLPIGVVSRFPSEGDALPAVTETEACG